MHHVAVWRDVFKITKRGIGQVGKLQDEMDELEDELIAADTKLEAAGRKVATGEELIAELESELAAKDLQMAAKDERLALTEEGERACRVELEQLRSASPRERAPLPGFFPKQAAMDALEKSAAKKTELLARRDSTIDALNQKLAAALASVAEKHAAAGDAAATAGEQAAAAAAAARTELAAKAAENAELRLQVEKRIHFTAVTCGITF